MVTANLQTAPTPGAVGVIQLAGEPAAVEAVLTALTGRERWPQRRLLLVTFAEIDSGLACVGMTGGGEATAWLMPHGGPRVIERLLDWLASHGCELIGDAPAMQVYPEADSPIEADVLAMISSAASPAAINLLLQQPARWRAWAGLNGDDRQAAAGQALKAAGALLHLVTPPTVLVVGQPNVGKSTLTNRMLGRSASVVADLPGTTRDWVGALAELGPSEEAVAVQWIDTPGLRLSDDAIEQRAITLAHEVIASADVIIALRSPDTDWPDVADLPREPDLWAINKADQLAEAAGGDGQSRETALLVSAHEGRGVERLEQQVLACLGLAEVAGDVLWAFNERLMRAAADNDPAVLDGYVESR